MIKLIVLDRDGVINYDSEAFIKSPKEWLPIPGSLEAISKLNKAGYQVVVATNQSGITRGLLSLEELHDIHKKMDENIRAVGGHIKGIFVCPHGPNDDCECRKPKTGLLKTIAEKYKLKPEEMLIIGDSMRDLLAAYNFGAPAILVGTGNGIETLALMQSENRTVTFFPDLSKAVDAILEGCISLS